MSYIDGSGVKQALAEELGREEMARAIGFRGTNTGAMPRTPKRWTVMAWDLNDKLMLGEQHRDRASANTRATALANRSDVLRVRHFETDAPAKRPSGRAR